jgi:hypothetical protein
MEKISTVQTSGREIFKGGKLTIGLDLGDHSSFDCVIDDAGEVIESIVVNEQIVEKSFCQCHWEI